jgi:hypothetical protein
MEVAGSCTQVIDQLTLPGSMEVKIAAFDRTF